MKRINQIIKIRWMMLLFIILFLTSSIIISADELHVYSPMDGSYNEPNYYNDLQKAVNQAKNNDTIYFHTGYYFVLDTIYINKSINIIGVGNGTHIMETLFQNKSLTLMKINEENVSISNLNIFASDFFTITIQINANHTMISNNFINNTFLGIYMNQSSFNIIKDNTISNNSLKGIISSFSDTSNNIIKNNTFSNNERGAISLFNSFEYSLENNTFSNNNDFSLILIDSQSNKINDNTFYNNSFGAIYNSNSEDIFIQNNHLLGGGSYGIYIIKSNKIYVYDNSISNYKYGLNISKDSNNIFLNNTEFMHNEKDINGIVQDTNDNSDNQINDTNTIHFKELLILLIVSTVFLYIRKKS